MKVTIGISLKAIPENHPLKTAQSEHAVAVYKEIEIDKDTAGKLEMIVGEKLVVVTVNETSDTEDDNICFLS